MSGADPESDSLKQKTAAFLSEFFAKGELLVRELIEENDRLRAMIGGKTPSAAPTVSAEQLRGLMSRLESLERECNEIRRLAGSAQRESGGYRGALEVLEHEHYHLASMYVAANQFNAGPGVEDVLNTLTEVLLNFIGVGGFTIYCVDEARGVFFPIRREGGRIGDMEEIAVDGGTDAALRTLLALGRPWHAGDPRGAGEGVIMQLPLVSGSRLVGLVRIESFLPQKTAFTETDHGLLEMLSERAGGGLETAWIRAHANHAPLQRVRLEALVKT